MGTEPVVHTEGVRHEVRDTNMPALALFGAAIVVTVAIVMLFCWGLFRIYAHVQSLGPSATPFASSRRLPPEPRLQAQPKIDLQNYLNAQQSELNTYGWVDQRNGIVHIPIQRAMQLLLQRGLRVRNSSQPAHASANLAFPETKRRP
jgi:hypothetical protein